MTYPDKSIFKNIQLINAEVVEISDLKLGTRYSLLQCLNLKSLKYSDLRKQYDKYSDIEKSMQIELKGLYERFNQRQN